MSTPVVGTVWGEDTPRARRNDRIESHQAADSISAEGLQRSERAVLSVLADAGRPVTDSEMFKMVAARGFVYEDSRLRTARHQLVVAGCVVQAGVGKTPKGRRAATWVLNADGEKALRNGGNK